MAKRPRAIPNVKPVTFERFFVSDDGEQLVFEVHDSAGNVGHIAISWLQLGLTAQLLGQGAERVAVRRKQLGKTSDFTGAEDLKAQIVSGFQVSEYPGAGLKVLTLQSPAGFRWDFAIRADTQDQRGRSLPRAIAEELLASATDTTRRPN